MKSDREISVDNVFGLIPAQLETEVFEDIVNTPNVRIERILSHGQTSPESGWYDQDEHEWVIVLQGNARLAFADGSAVDLGPGDHINIPAHRLHQVVWTDPATVTVWLAVFYKPALS